MPFMCLRRDPVLMTDKDGTYWLMETTYPKEAKVVYRNHFRANGEIMAESSFQATDVNVRVSNSTVLWWQYQHLLNDGVQLKITRLRRHEVSNTQTQDTARVCFLCSSSLTKFPVSWQMNWKGGEQLNALKGTPNGLAGIYLVKDWSQQLGITGIESIYVDKPEPLGNRQIDMLITFTREEDKILPVKFEQ